MRPDWSGLTPAALWTPTQHTVVLAGVLVAAVLLASVAIVGRDAWLEEARRHRRLLRRAALGGLVAIGIAVLIAHHSELEELLRRIERGDLGVHLVAADIATLWACFKAYGEPPPIATLVLCYFLGQMGNLLPLPGGVGGTEGGMVGALAASDVDAGLALLAVVTYQLISTYLPALPGLASYVSLRRRMKGWPPVGPDQGRLARTAVP